MAGPQWRFKERHRGKDVTYTVTDDGQTMTCECKSYLFERASGMKHQPACKHISAVLLQQTKVPLLGMNPSQRTVRSTRGHGDKFIHPWRTYFPTHIKGVPVHLPVDIFIAMDEMQSPSSVPVLMESTLFGVPVDWTAQNGDAFVTVGFAYDGQLMTRTQAFWDFACPHLLTEVHIRCLGCHRKGYGEGSERDWLAFVLGLRTYTEYCQECHMMQTSAQAT
ncbi:MAG: hypothetical protein AB7O86_05945 [Porticoccaceae bacterium]